MNGKDGRDKRAPPEGGSHFSQHEKEQNNDQCVQKHIGEVMAAGSKAIAPAIKHVRNGGQRMPIAGMNVSESPGNSVECQTDDDLRIFVDIGVVVVINELVMERLTEDDPGKRDQSDADRSDRFLVARLA